MTEEQILECTKVVYDFLCDDFDRRDYDSLSEIPTLNVMSKVLKVYGFGMIDFCQFVNDKYNFYEKPLWVKDAQEFFSDDFSQPGPSKAKLMLKSLLRDQKLNEILC